ncbi:phytoene desaturase family protein [Limnofasciculus baicalensis]|uniref:NAD(P)/FAD-dependent oxidoreductase n=1 Tax=Limnofasciculus baicalensis BBK-W-15 TaxID=2699891 RepID=A0AAE3GPE6_9CYAN|nr:NAD(P)/FAD-dependent oxidoreductase [Limnofasciculus baicalensis]MCP2727398.1 NAD(P)/FAD-dependent oxidoreductase [Limnofasciculus baicalensis BBK-W-15]
MKHKCDETIIIIGAGIAGLAAGCYAQMNGYRTQIFEMHDRPGGLCTAWQRQGFIFDGCIHYLFGSARGQPFYQLWEELGVAGQQQFVHHDELLRVSKPDGKTLIVYSNPDRLEQHLKEISPIDRRLISDLCTGIRTFTRFDLSLLQQQPKALMQLGDWGKLARKMLPFICPLVRWGNLSAAEFAERFQDHQAIGVRLYNNETCDADRIISACDGHNTLFGLLDRQYVPREIQRYYDGHLPIHSQLQVSLGVNRDLSNEPHWTTHLLNEPVVIAGEKRYEIGVKHYCFDPSLAPPGKSVLMVVLTTNYDYWQRIYGRSIYDAEEIQESQIIIDLLDRFYPGIKNDIEFVDVATPLTYERYTGNWQGSSCGWLLTKQTLPLSIKGLPKTLPKLRNFYAIGQWVEPGGSVPVVAMSGRNIIQQICREDKQTFRSITPEK